MKKRLAKKMTKKTNLVNFHGIRTSAAMLEDAVFPSSPDAISVGSVIHMLKERYEDNGTYNEENSFNLAVNGGLMEEFDAFNSRIDIQLCDELLKMSEYSSTEYSPDLKKIVQEMHVPYL